MKTTITIIFLSLLSFSFISCKTAGRGGVKTSDRPAAGQISDDSLLTLVEKGTFEYFWDGAEPNSGMACERINVKWYLSGKRPAHCKHGRIRLRHYGYPGRHRTGICQQRGSR
jgi:hypothetical protein